jgi:hypothetical protein
MAFTFKLEHPDGTPAEPPTLKSAVPNREIGEFHEAAADRLGLLVDPRDPPGSGPRGRWVALISSGPPRSP